MKEIKRIEIETDGILCDEKCPFIVDYGRLCSLFNYPVLFRRSVDGRKERCDRCQNTDNGAIVVLYDGTFSDHSVPFEGDTILCGEQQVTLTKLDGKKGKLIFLEDK